MFYLDVHANSRCIHHSGNPRVARGWWLDTDTPRRLHVGSGGKDHCPRPADGSTTPTSPSPGPCVENKLQYRNRPVAVACVAAGGQDPTLPMPSTPPSPEPFWIGIAQPPSRRFVHCPRQADCRRISQAVVSRRRRGGKVRCGNGMPTTARGPAGGLDPVLQIPGIAVSPTTTTVAIAENPHRRCVHCPWLADSGHHFRVHFAPTTTVPHRHNDIDCPRVVDSQRHFWVHVPPALWAAVRPRWRLLSATPRHGAPCPVPMDAGVNDEGCRLRRATGGKGHLGIGASHALCGCCHAPRRVGADGH